MDELLTIDAGWQGRDYSYARPDLADLRQLDQRFIVRYVRSPFTHPKVVGPLEAARIRNNGLGLVVVFELDQLRPLHGSAAGAIDGTVTREYCQLLGQPEAVAVMCAVDIDTITAAQGSASRPSNLAAVRAYLEGFSSTAAPYPWGVYGDWEAIDEALELGSALNWQMGARSFSHAKIHPAAHVVQAPELWPQLGYQGRHSDQQSDSNLCLRPFASWGPARVTQPDPPAPFPTSDELETYTMSATALPQMVRDQRYTVVLLVGAGVPEWLTSERVTALSAAGVPMIVQAAHPSFTVLAARAGVPDLASYPAG